MQIHLQLLGNGLVGIGFIIKILSSRERSGMTLYTKSFRSEEGRFEALERRRDPTTRQSAGAANKARMPGRREQSAYAGASRTKRVCRGAADRSGELVGAGAVRRVGRERELALVASFGAKWGAAEVVPLWERVRWPIFPGVYEAWAMVCSRASSWR
jgi:hypothetical protein